MREPSGSQTEPKTEEATEGDGHIWRTKWGAAEATPGRGRAANAKIAGIVLVAVVGLAVAIFLMVGGPSRLASRNFQRAPITNVATPAPAEVQPVGGLENFVPPIGPALVP